jgi:hypothetical protein
MNSKNYWSKKIKADLSNPIGAYYNSPWTIPLLKKMR